MHRHQIKNYTLEGNDEYLLIKTESKTYEVPIDKIVDVIEVSDKDASFIRWYHIWIIRLLLVTFSLYLFYITANYSDYIDGLDSNTNVQGYLRTFLFLISGVFFVYMIQLLFEITSDFPGITPWFSRKVFARRKNYISVRRKTIEYQLKVRKVWANRVLNELEEICSKK